MKKSVVGHCSARTKADILKKGMACVTIDSLTRKVMLVECVKNRAIYSGKQMCTARKYIAKRASKSLVYYRGEHTCPFTAYSECATDVCHKVAENIDATPAQIQSSVIQTKLHQCRDWSEVEKATASVSDKR